MRGRVALLRLLRWRMRSAPVWIKLLPAFRYDSLFLFVYFFPPFKDVYQF
ncbi:hypothetical protein HanPSC8_Chr07g0306241 [Helianthus annuus]|nr:hypothetical protein HanPSC8_Chr07g0306241 [Helianthus annuus]